MSKIPNFEPFWPWQGSSELAKQFLKSKEGSDQNSFGAEQGVIGVKEHDGKRIGAIRVPFSYATDSFSDPVLRLS